MSTAVNIPFKNSSTRASTVSYPSMTLEQTSLLDEEDLEFFEDLIEEVNAGLQEYDPELVDEGEGGTYFIKSLDGDIIAVLKPTDEDPQSVNNPKKKQYSNNKNLSFNDDDDDNLSSSLKDDYSGLSAQLSSSSSDLDISFNDDSGLKRGIPDGQTAIREVAAYQLDHYRTLPDCQAGVPKTCLVSFHNPGDGEERTQLASLQVFVRNATPGWDMGPSRYSVAQVHAIGVLDIRLMNTDRHEGNLLVLNTNSRFKQKASPSYSTLVPIDHAYALPTSFAQMCQFEWMHWPQARQPFSAEMLAAIKNIDVQQDAALLRKMGVEEAAIRVNSIATALLKSGAEQGLTLYEIANLCRRKRLEQPCPIEIALNQLLSLDFEMKEKEEEKLVSDFTALQGFLLEKVVGVHLSAVSTGILVK